jgi:PAS domain S-box-containing protein
MLKDPRAKTGQRTLVAESYPPWLVSVGLTIAVGAAYFLAARLSLALLAQPAGVAVFWPAAGVAAGLLISIGPTARWPVILGTMAATILANTLGDRNIWSSMVFAVCNAGEAVLISALLERFFGSPFSLDRLQRVLGLLLAAIFGTAVSGIGGTAGYLLFHTSTASALTIWSLWFASDAIGVMTVAPLIIGIFSVVRYPPPHKEVLEGFLVLALTALLSAFVVHLPSSVWAVELSIACLFPLLLWVAARCRPAFAAAATFIFALTVVWTTTFGFGIFGSPELRIADRILIAQVAILAQSLCALVLAALFAERRQHEARFRESEARLQDALRAGAVTAFDWIVHTDISRRSENAAQILGYDPNQAYTATHFLERIHPDDRQRFKACIRGLRPGKPSYAVTFRYLRPDGQEVWLEEAAQAEFDPEGLVAHVSGLTRDITERKRVELELAAARSAAELADRAKSGFLAAASHDLRQPLQTLNLLQRALKPRVDDEARTLVDRIGRSADVMTGILNSLLDINQLEAGALRPSMSDFPVNDVFDAIAADFLEPIREKRLEWRLVRSGIVVHSDRRMLEEMVRNLLSNAVRYTDRGRILVGCRRAGDKARIEVWDSGVGIVGEQIPRIFEEYYQGQDSTKLGGFGLGLAIVQRLAKVLNHHVDVRSTPGKGSGFFIELPLAHQKVNGGADRSKRLSGRADDSFLGTILVIEDESSVRTGLESLLSSVGLGVVSVATGKEALDLVTTERMRPDLIISDFNLPGPMNGVEVIEALRAALARKTPAIVMTGDIRSRAIASIAGADVGLAVKPMAGDELLKLINELQARSKLSSASA